MLNRSLFLTLVVCLTTTIAAQARETVLPAGTLLQCTLDERNFSSRSAEVGDPVLCSAGSVRQFERELLPLGAYVAGHFEDYREPGRFVGNESRGFTADLGGEEGITLGFFTNKARGRTLFHLNL